MRKNSTIVAVVATIIMLGAVAQAQTMNPTLVMANNDLVLGDYGLNGSANWTIQGTTGTQARAINNFYMQSTNAAAVINTTGTATSKATTVANYYAIAGALSKTKTGSAALNISNFWLQVGDNLTNKVNLTGTGIVVEGLAGGTTATNGTNNFNVVNNNYGIDITSGGTVRDLNITGGTVKNAGTITEITNAFTSGKIENSGTIGSLIFGGGDYSGNGTVNTLGFTAGTELNLGEKSFGLTQFTNVNAYDLSDTNLFLSATGLEFVDGIASILFNFGGGNKIGSDFALFTLTGFLGGVEN